MGTTGAVLVPGVRKSLGPPITGEGFTSSRVKVRRCGEKKKQTSGQCPKKLLWWQQPSHKLVKALGQCRVTKHHKHTKYTDKGSETKPKNLLLVVLQNVNTESSAHVDGDQRFLALRSSWAPKSFFVNVLTSSFSLHANFSTHTVGLVHKYLPHNPAHTSKKMHVWAKWWPRSRTRQKPFDMV